MLVDMNQLNFYKATLDECSCMNVRISVRLTKRSIITPCVTY